MKSCGCRKKYPLRDGKADIAGMKFGRLTALCATEKRDYKRSVFWRCRCECGTEVDVSEDDLVSGNTMSCGCRARETRESIWSQLTFVDGTCLELLEYRKHRNDNKSGFRGVNRNGSGKWRATIGLQGRRYHIGSFDTMEEAVAARLKAEKLLHGGFVESYRRYAAQAERDPAWAEQNPFFFRVTRSGGNFRIDTPEIPKEKNAAGESAPQFIRERKNHDGERTAAPEPAGTAGAAY